MKRYIKSFTTDELKSALGDNYPKSGYLYIFKHGIGPGTIPDDVRIVKVKDLPNYYTAVWLDRFLTTPELKQYDIPDETRITELLNRIGYCQKNGDVVPCDEVEACGDIKGSTKVCADDTETEWYDWWNDVDGYLLNYDEDFKKLIYDFRDKYGWPKDMKDGLCDKLGDVIFKYVKDNTKKLDIDPSENTDADYAEFADSRMVEWLVEPELYGDFWDDYLDKDVTGSTKPRYMANMVSASSSDSAYDENDEPYRYYVAGYYSVDSNGHPYGLAESLYTNDFDEALETAHTYCGNGDYVEFTNQITGMSLDYDPDDWNEAIEYGEFPTSVYDLF